MGEPKEVASTRIAVKPSTLKYLAAITGKAHSYDDALRVLIHRNANKPLWEN